MMMAGSVLHSCGPRTYVCYCNSASTKTGQHYSVGTVSAADATGKCNALKSQYAWDTCLTVSEAQ